MKPAGEEHKNIFEVKPLRDIYPEVEQRQKFCDKKKSESKLTTPVVVRIEPYPKTLLHHAYQTLVMDKWTKMSKVNSMLHKRILKLDSTTSLCLFSGKKIVNLDMECGEMLRLS